MSGRGNYFDDLIRAKKTIIQNDEKDTSNSNAQECFQFFDEDRDGVLNSHEFHQLCRQLLSQPDFGQEWTRQDTEKIMELLKINDGKLDVAKFQNCWKNWIRRILVPKCALVVIDVQNDFITGSLALKNGPAKEDGAEVVPVINRLLDAVQFEEVIYCHDWHPTNHISFYENLHMWKLHPTSPKTANEAQPLDTVIFDGSGSIPIVQTLWPTHCVQKSTGAALHEDLKIVENHFKAFKGTNPEQDNYSALYPTPEPKNNTSGEALAARLRRKGITDLFLCGLAFDVCVALTALDSCRLGFRTIAIEDACRGIHKERIKSMRENMTDAGCAVVNTKQVVDMVSGHYRHLKLAYFAALDNSATGL